MLKFNVSSNSTDYGFTNQYDDWFHTHYKKNTSDPNENVFYMAVYHVARTGNLYFGGTPITTEFADYMMWAYQGNFS